MKTIGLIGGTGWVSTQEYYKIINEKVNEKLGDLQFPQIILYSVNYGEIAVCNQNNDREGVYKIIKKGADTLVDSGVDFLALCANTTHFTFNQLTQEIRVPFVHIADATGAKIREEGIKKAGLLGTRQTMEMDFYKERLAKMGIKVITPDKQEREFIHKAIMEELLIEQFLPETRKGFLNIMDALKAKGAEGIILGCTEIPLLLKQSDYDLHLFNTLEIHAEAIASFALSD